MMGIPILPRLATPRGAPQVVTPLAVPRVNRKRADVLRQVGNTMQGPVIAAWLLWCMLFVLKPDEIPEEESSVAKDVPEKRQKYSD
jgi:hypothetical protein